MRATSPSGAPAELAVLSGGRLRPLFDDLSARLADEHGWAVCAVEPFAGREDLTLEERLEAPPREHLVDDLLAAADATGCPRTAALGFCMGGLVAFGAAGLGRFEPGRVVLRDDPCARAGSRRPASGTAGPAVPGS